MITLETSAMFLLAWTSLCATVALVYSFLNHREYLKMSVTAQQAQQDLDDLSTGVVQLLPDVIKTMGDQSSIITDLRKQLVDAGHTPQTGLDPDAVEADVQSIKNQLAALSVSNQSAKDSEGPLPTPTPTPTDGTPPTA